MLPPQTIAQIMDASRIEDVVADFVTLKKRGSSYIANCPFHNEKTPSFHVSPSKGIFKCFGCGEGGDAVGFVMRHESMGYPDALRYLARKYGIQIEEVQSDEAVAEQRERDGLFLANQFAARHFQNNLFETEEGRNIGLSYFKERGFREETIKKFGLGYCPDSFDDFFRAATSKGLSAQTLEKLGLVRNKNGRHYDFFRNRVQFVIRNLSGKPIAFAGRTLLADKKTPKYINSPETDIYAKSKVLYGMFLAKNAIRKQDLCYLTEGYTDVISLHQAGIENVVASSGTSLTTDQIRLIKRYTPNVHVLYDGDQAGIKAALRGIDLLLEQDLNVKVLQLPENEDPDSFVKKNGKSGFEAYQAEHLKDFVLYKTQLLLREAQNDPVKRSHALHDIIGTIAVMPDPVKRMVYLQECARLTNTDENIIIAEINKLTAQRLKKKRGENQSPPPGLEEGKGFELKQQIGQAPSTSPEKELYGEAAGELRETHIVQSLLEYGGKNMKDGTLVAVYVVNAVVELLQFETGKVRVFKLGEHRKIVDIWRENLENGNVLDKTHFVSHADDAVRKAAVNALSSPYEISGNWEEKHQIYVKAPAERYNEIVVNTVKRFQLDWVCRLLAQATEELGGQTDGEKVLEVMKRHLQLTALKKKLSEELGTGITH